MGPELLLAFCFCFFLTSFNIRITPGSQQIWFTSRCEVEKVHKHSSIVKHRTHSALGDPKEAGSPVFCSPAGWGSKVLASQLVPITFFAFV